MMPLSILQRFPVLLLLLIAVVCGFCAATVVETEVAEVKESSSEMEEVVSLRRTECVRERRSFGHLPISHCRIRLPLEVVERPLDDRVGVSEHSHRNGIGCPLAL